MRGRTFLNKYVIIDEAQNLTPKQKKTLITRAGPGTKIICVGNLARIDTPYLTDGSSGMTYAGTPRWREASAQDVLILRAKFCRNPCLKCKKPSQSTWLFYLSSGRYNFRTCDTCSVKTGINPFFMRGSRGYCGCYADDIYDFYRYQF